MSKEVKRVQDVFNEISNATSVVSIKEALTGIDYLNDKDKKALLDALEDHLVLDFTVNTPTMEEFRTDEILQDLAKVGNAEGKKYIESWHVSLALVGKIIGEKKDQSAPMLQEIMDAVSKLSDAEYSDFKTFTASLSKTVANYNATQKPKHYRR